MQNMIILNKELENKLKEAESNKKPDRKFGKKFKKEKKRIKHTNKEKEKVFKIKEYHIKTTAEWYIPFIFMKEGCENVNLNQLKATLNKLHEIYFASQKIPKYLHETLKDQAWSTAESNFWKDDNFVTVVKILQLTPASDKMFKCYEANEKKIALLNGVLKELKSKLNKKSYRPF